MRKYIINFILFIALFAFSASFAQAQEAAVVINNSTEGPTVIDETPEHESEEYTDDSIVVVTRNSQDETVKEPLKLRYTDGSPANWDWGIDLTFKGGIAGTTQLMIVPTNYGLSESIAIGFHNARAGVTVEYEIGRLHDIGTLKDPASDGELWTFFDDMTGLYHAVAATFDFYCNFEKLVFVAGVGGAIFMTLPNENVHRAGGLRLDFSLQWRISKQLRAGFDFEITTAFLWNHFRPSMVLAIAL